MREGVGSVIKLSIFVEHFEPEVAGVGPGRRENMIIRFEDDEDDEKICCVCMCDGAGVGAVGDGGGSVAEFYAWTEFGDTEFDTAQFGADVC